MTKLPILITERIECHSGLARLGCLRCMAIHRQALLDYELGQTPRGGEVLL